MRTLTLELLLAKQSFAITLHYDKNKKFNEIYGPDNGSNRDRHTSRVSETFPEVSCHPLAAPDFSPQPAGLSAASGNLHLTKPRPTSPYPKALCTDPDDPITT